MRLERKEPAPRSRLRVWSLEQEQKHHLGGNLFFGHANSTESETGVRAQHVSEQAFLTIRMNAEFYESLVQSGGSQS